MAKKFIDLAAFGDAVNGLEVLELVAQNDANGNPLYTGQAVPGSDPADPVWRIKQFTYDANDAVLTIKFANNSVNMAFVWDSRSTYF